MVPAGSPVVTPPVLGPIGTCDATVSLDGEEQRFLTLVNQYRRTNSVRAIDASPALTRAARRHVHDMATHNFLAHTGSDGSDPSRRASDAGYTGGVGENVLRGSASAVEAIAGWQSSHTGHNENMVNPNWVAVGIAREQNPTTHEWFWATSYGDLLDCPLTVADTLVQDQMVASDLPDAAPDMRDSQVLVARAPVLDLSPPTGGPRGRALPLEMLAADQALSQPPVPALAVTPARTTVGDTVTFVNRSRDANGQPTSATIDFGDGSAIGTLAPNGALQHSYPTAGTASVTLATTTAGGTLAVTRPLVVDALPADFTIVTGPTSQVLAPGSTATFVVTLNSVGGFNQPVTLTVTGLPLGVSAVFSAPQVTPLALRCSR